MYTFFKSTDRRYKILAVSPELIVESLFSRPIGIDKAIEVSGLPTGCKVEAVCYDYERACFRFRLYHPSFPVVPECGVIPEVDVVVKQVEKSAFVGFLDDVQKAIQGDAAAKQRLKDQGVKEVPPGKVDTIFGTPIEWVDKIEGTPDNPFYYREA